jgi:hypothetical protein
MAGGGKAVVSGSLKPAVEIAGSTELSRLEVFERRSRVWQSFLERQSVATMIGAFLLIAIFVFIATSTLLGKPVPELVSNAFLVILGYFFGNGAQVREAEPHLRPDRPSRTCSKRHGRAT